MTKLDAVKDTEQLIVVAGVDKTTAYITMHEKSEDGKWQQLIATPGFIGLDGLAMPTSTTAIHPWEPLPLTKPSGLQMTPAVR